MQCFIRILRMNGCVNGFPRVCEDRCFYYIDNVAPRSQFVRTIDI